jgi:ATP-dependent RNA helicase DeaD
MSISENTPGSDSEDMSGTNSTSHSNENVMSNEVETQQTEAQVTEQQNTDEQAVTEEVVAEEVVAEEAVAEEAVAEEAVAEEVVAEEAVAEEAVAEEVVAEEVVAEEAVAEEVVAEEVVAEEAVAEEAVAEEVVAEEAVAEEAVAEEVVAEEVVAEEPVAEEPVAEEPENGFRPLGLSEDIISAVESSGYTIPTPIQAETIPLLLEGRDVLGQAQTGTGKTAAFAMPLLDRIDLSNRDPQVVVLAPTRELAIQVAESFEKYSKHMRGLRVVPIYGGQDYMVQFRQLNRGAHVIVGTPGRVMDHMRRGSFNLDNLQCLVLDEADEMLRMGFADDVEWVLTKAPEKRQMALFSATMPKQIRNIAQKHLNNPAEITIKQRTATADTVNQRYFVAQPRQKQDSLARILEAEPTDGVLVFVKTKSTTEPLAEFLAECGLKTAALNGDIPQNRRERIVDALRTGKVDIIVATDVAARGLDVQRISHVINYDLPYDSEAYVHRIGRTGRAGRSGEAILFVHPRERQMLKRIEQATRQKIEQMDLPSNRAINIQRVARFHEKITEALGSSDMDRFEAIVEHYRRDSDLPLEKIAAALAVLANGGTPLIVKDSLTQASFSEGKQRERDGRNSRSDRRSGPHKPDSGMATFRIEVGRTDNVQPGNIVGAIANESGIGSDKIGRIMIFDRYSTVDLPEDLSNDVIQGLKNVFVGGQRMQISRADERRPRSGGSGGSGGSQSGSRDGKRSFSRSKPKLKNYKKRSAKQ